MKIPKFNLLATITCCLSVDVFWIQYARANQTHLSTTLSELVDARSLVDEQHLNIGRETTIQLAQIQNQRD